MAKGEIEGERTWGGPDSKIVAMIKEGTDGTNEGDCKRFISCRAAMDYLGIQGHSTFYKCTREQIPFNGWLLVHKNDEGSGGAAGAAGGGGGAAKKRAKGKKGKKR